MLKGYVQAEKGIKVSDAKLRRWMPYISQQGHSSRQTGAQERRNPSIYSARYFGHKLHYDQNEKLVHYGVTYVMARDGFSGKIIGGAVMPVKNNHLIYDIYCTAVLEYGMWDQIRVDHGREFYLILFIQEHLRLGRGDSQIAPYVQTTSTNNHVIERMWVELNQRVTYPVKTVVTAMDNQGHIDMNDTSTKYSVSAVLLQVCEVGMKRFIAAWNSHSIPKRGVPNRIQEQGYNTGNIHPVEVPDVSTAVEMYTDQGGTLTDPTTFGIDPLRDNSSLIEERQDRWSSECGMPVEDIFSNLVSGNSVPLENAITSFITITEQLSQ